MSNYSQHCPICARPVENNNSFPNYVCNACRDHATDAKGETVIFYHARFNGKGYQGYYRRHNELVPFTENICFINGVKCNAFDDYAGGVIIQPVKELATALKPEIKHAAVAQF